MKKDNKTGCANLSIDDLLTSLHLSRIDISDQSGEDTSDDEIIEYIPQSAHNSHTPQFIQNTGISREFNINRFIEEREYTISRGTLPFSMIEAVGAKKRSENNTTTLNHNLIIRRGMYDYGFTKQDIDKYRIRRKKRTKAVCPNWEDIPEHRENEPTRVSVRSIRLSKKQKTLN
ncbi:hypothetical protein CWI42_080500 [Ordospora colligata]|uniref:Uncharacterized protein n=1 Tax=Ordospora colligata OC4 TaxID=1354746 RepID=A0A0B2UJV5_9MICR|nr:uncharacterized protein M896_080510 [Ordospora colligata OC4]KHN69317.1 hypothetical protein M896_080510 [Ordospora colligata OC4]TBU14831.1 hypothetical protein CWI41_080500 [Ordospora colligata]TBU14962.1 hypothetical protein CWI40_080520 [Ordospora colligata]TBU18346.1 hypothetical protein CWI42_080500 [Ordospora colligata]